MDVKPFVMLGDSVLAAARERASSALTAWRAAWGVEGEGLDVATARAAAERCGEPGWRAYRAGDATRAWVRFDVLALEAFEDALFRGIERESLRPRSAESMASAVALDARDDLLASLLGALRGKHAVRGTLALEVPPAALFRHGAGTLYLRVHAADAVMHLLVVHQELARPPRAAEAGATEAAAVQGLGTAVSDMPITLQAQLGSIEIELGALHGLVAGDVIRLGAKIEQPLAVVGPDGAILCHGHLGVHDGARALDLVH